MCNMTEDRNKIKRADSLPMFLSLGFYALVFACCYFICDGVMKMFSLHQPIMSFFISGICSAYILLKESLV